MRDFLITICPAAIWILVALEIAIAVMLFVLYRRSGKKGALLGGILTVGLVIDAALIGLGVFMPEKAIMAVSPVRFIAHGFLIPLLFPICGYALKLKKPVMTGLWVFTGILMVAGVAQAVATPLEIMDFAGVIRCKTGAGTPAWASIIEKILSFGTVIPMMIAGIVVWIKQKKPYLFLSGFLMFVFSALGPATGNADFIFFISMFGELFMVLFIYFAFKGSDKEKD